MFKTLVCVVLAAAALTAQTPPASDVPYPFRDADLSKSPRITKLRRDIQTNRESAVEQFWNEVRQNGAPLVEPIPGDDNHSFVTFVWRGSAGAKNVVITDGVSIGIGDADPVKSEMTRIPNTDVWYRTYDVRNDARFTYALSENDSLVSFLAPNRGGNSKPDPFNSHKFLTGQTYLELRDAPPQPWSLPAPPENSGRLENVALSGRNLWVYMPHGFQPNDKAYPMVVLMGGAAYVRFIPVAAILDNLIAAKRIPPSLAVVVGSSNEELMCSTAFTDFLAKELVPWMRTTYHATDDPQQTVIGGASLGGLESTFTAVTNPGVFGKVLSQSGSYWWKPDNEKEDEWLTRRIQSTSKLPLQFFLEVGRMEAVDLQLGSNRRMRDTLVARGYSVQYREFNGNHNYINWQGGLGEGLIALLGQRVP
jgi:enterochelin esterase family protein